MASFTGEDYDRLFELGRELYLDDSPKTRKQIAVTLMAMSESVRGQKVPWPKIAAPYRHFTNYPRTVIAIKAAKALLASAALCALLCAPAAAAEPSPPPALSMAYASTGCGAGPAGATFMLFGPQGNQWRLSPYVDQQGAPGAKPGSGSFPTRPFWVRAVSLSMYGPRNGEWAVVGHAGPRGDWVSRVAWSNQGDVTKDYPSNGAPYFDYAEYLDVHTVSACLEGTGVLLAIWYVVAP